MKLLLIALLVAFASADVSHIVSSAEATAQIVKQELEMGVDGSYNWNIQTANGISAGEQGFLKNPQSEDAAETVQGYAEWTAPDGEDVKLTYIADENGYQPQGAHLPTPPPIPEGILRALDYVQKHPPAPERP